MKPDAIAVAELLTLALASVAAYLTLVFSWVWVVVPYLHLHPLTSFVVSALCGWFFGTRAPHLLKPVMRTIWIDHMIRVETGLLRAAMERAQRPREEIEALVQAAKHELRQTLRKP